MMKTKEEIKESQILNRDFKDILNPDDYEKVIDNFEDLSNIQKWLLYDKYAKKDADVVLKRNSDVLKKLKWDNNIYFDAIFPVRQILYTLFKTIDQKIDDIELLNGRKEIFEIIDRQKLKKLYEELEECEEESEKWIDELGNELDKYCKNVHTIGNYMPCPDNKYNSVKGFKGKWHYNDRIDLLYSDIVETDPNKKCKNTKGDDIIDSQQRECWKRKFEEKNKLEDEDNKENWFLNEILEKEKIRTLGKFGCLKKTVFSGDELKQFKELPKYLQTANELIDGRSSKIRNQFK